MEGTVLLGVQYFQQGRGGVAVVGVLRHLVYLVQYEDRVARTRLLDVLDDAAGHGTDVGATVSADFGLVVQSAQRYAHVFALQGVGYRLAQRRLTHTRRTVQAEDGRLQVTTQREHGDVLQDALLHLLHAVVVAVQYLLRTAQVQVVLRIFAPGQSHQRLQVGQLHVVVGRVRVHLVQFLYLLIEELLDVLGPLLLGGLLQQLLLLGRVLVAHLGLQVLDLLLQEVVPLLFVDVVARLVANVQLQRLQVNLAVHDTHGVEQALLDRVQLQQGHLLLDAERHVRADEVQRHHVVADVLDGEGGLFGYLVAHVNVLGRLVAQVLHSGAELYVLMVGLNLGGTLYATYQVRLVLQQLLQAQATQPLHDGRDVAVGHGQYFDYFGKYADVVEVGTNRILHFGVALTHHTNDRILLLGLANELHARLAANQDRRHHSREQYQIAHRQDGQCLGHLQVCQVAVVAFYVGYHGERLVPVIHIHYCLVFHFLFHNEVQRYDFFLK